MAGRPSRVRAADRHQQILQVAMELFARQGFRGTTTRRIAERAGINEAIIFRHFPRKEDLYWAIIEAKCRSGNGRRKLPHKLRSEAGDAEALAAIA